jgi:hypothetical protein
MGEARSALLIGIGRYDNSGDLKSLDGPRVDVQSMRAVLEDPDAGGYRVETLEDVDSATACGHLEGFLRERSENETCLLYFSGHGFIDANGALYLCTTNASFKRPKTTTIPANFVSGLIDECQSKRVVLLLDCCYSGNYDGSAKAADVVQPQFVGTGFGRVVLTAGAENQLAWDNGEKGSLFSRHIAEGIRSGAADTDGDGRITVHELYDYVYKKVVSERPTQRPGKNTYRETGPSFLIAESRAKRVEQVPAWLQHELSSKVAETRCNALKALDELVEMKPGTRGLVVERLRAALDDDSNRVRMLAKELLGKLGDAKAPSAQPASPPVAPVTTATPAAPITQSPEKRIFPLTVEVVLWLLWAAFGALLGFVLPISNQLVTSDDAEFVLCANVFLICYGTFLVLRYRSLPDVASIGRSLSWWIGVVALVLANFSLSGYVQTHASVTLLFVLYVMFNLVGLVMFSRLVLRLRILAAVGVGLLMALVWTFGYIVWPDAFSRYDSDRFLPAWVVTAVVVVSLGALSRSRSLKSHAK